MATATYRSRHAALMVHAEMAGAWEDRQAAAGLMSESDDRRTREASDVIIAEPGHSPVRHHLRGPDQQMQILQLVIIVTAVLAALVIFASGSRRSIGPAALGPVIGLLAAFVVLVRTTDLMPDPVEDEVGDLVVTVLIFAAAAVLVRLAIHLSRRE